MHTDNSLDANGFGARIGPEEALRFARGEEVVSSSGVLMKLSRPLDWVVVADHSDGMGAMKEIRLGNPRLIADPTVRDWYNRFKKGGEAAFEATGLSAEDIDWLIPHQANRRIIDASAKKLNIASEKVVLTVNQHGNTSAASIPLAIDVAVSDGRLKEGDLVLLEAMGGGFTWGAVLVRW